MKRNPWLENLFHPLVIGAMVGCIALSLVELIRLIVPTWNGTYLIVGCVLAALEANYSHRLVRAKTSGISGGWWMWTSTEVLRFRAVELAMLSILLKIGSYIGDSWAAVLADIKTWPQNPLAIVDPETVVAFVLAFLSWRASTQTVRDLERLYEPPERSVFYVPPTESLASRFFWGGAVLLIVTGITRIGIAALLNLSRPSVPGLVLNVLVYFLLGLVMLGQVHFSTLRKRWQTQQVRVADEVPGRWVRYSLAFLGLAALLAFLLPTGYTMSLLDVTRLVLSLILGILWFIAWLISILLILPLAWLLFTLFGQGESPSARRLLPPPQLPQPSPGPIGPAPDWLEILRSLVFWAVALGMVAYVVRSYLRDHPELVAALSELQPIRALRAWWAAFWRWSRGWLEVVSERLPPGFSLRPARPRPSEQPVRFFRLGALPPREQVLYYYLSILHRAARQGFPRRPAQTPYEYDVTLEPHLPEARSEMARLTAAFVEARYSRHTVQSDQARHARDAWQRVKAALQALRRQVDAGNPPKT